MASFQITDISDPKINVRKKQKRLWKNLSMIEDSLNILKRNHNMYERNFTDFTVEQQNKMFKSRSIS